MKIVRQWNRLPWEAVDAPSLEVFKAKLDEPLKAVPAHGKRLEYMSFEGSPQPKPLLIIWLYQNANDLVFEPLNLRQ